MPKLYPLLELPEELNEYIFNLLKRKDLQQSRLVCQDWNQFVVVKLFPKLSWAPNIFPVQVSRVRKMIMEGGSRERSARQEEERGSRGERRWRTATRRERGLISFSSTTGTQETGRPSPRPIWTTMVGWIS
jgi:hypothetical protein